MTDRLKGKRALVTAAGQGIGRASALAIVMILFILVPMAIYNHYSAEHDAVEE